MECDAPSFFIRILKNPDLFYMVVGTLYKNKVTHKPCSVFKQSSVWYWNYFQSLAIS